MIKITNRQGNIIGSIILFFIIIWTVFHHFRRENDLKTNGIIVDVTIVDILHNYNKAPSYQYKFFYKRIEYKNDNTTGLQTSNIFIGKNFPAIFSPNTGNSELLMTPEDFSKYDRQFPDSLQWVLQYRIN